jgi:hypothetical protein
MMVATLSLSTCRVAHNIYSHKGDRKYHIIEVSVHKPDRIVPKKKIYIYVPIYVPVYVYMYIYIHTHIYIFVL